MNIVIKYFNELTTQELYNILQLRSEVFVVEQNCIYQDIDGKDQKAVHIFIKENKDVLAYSRVFNEGEYFENPSIGRVVVKKEKRGTELGKKIMMEGAKYIKETFTNKKIEISAQKYLKDFYSELGYEFTGNEYLEDGIPHIRMIKQLI
jgi:ElaA protein